MTDNTETAILAGGCFWGVQELLRHTEMDSGVQTALVLAAVAPHVQLRARPI